MEDRWIAQGWLERTASKWMGLRGMKSDEARGVEGGQGGHLRKGILSDALVRPLRGQNASASTATPHDTTS